MKRVVGYAHRETEETINLCHIQDTVPIFAKLKGKLYGMVVEENKGWIIRIGGVFGEHGYHPTRSRCLESARSDMEFFVED